MNIPVFDFHCDTPVFLAKGASLAENNLHFDLKRASKFAGYAQCFACYTTTLDDKDPTLTLERGLAGINRELEKNKSIIRQAYTAEDILQNQEAGLMSAVLTLEGSAGYGFDPELLGVLYDAGVRIASLGWNEKNPLAGSHITGGGLTDLGKAFVNEAQRLGILIDVSHISDEAFWDIMDITQAPIIATHSNSRALCEHSRNISDEMFSAICKTGGIVGINMCADFLGENPTLDTACEHVKHFLDLDPTGKHIALGGDLDGCEDLPLDFKGVENYPDFAECMLENGIGIDTIKNIYWNNAIEVMKNAVHNNKK